MHRSQLSVVLLLLLAAVGASTAIPLESFAAANSNQLLVTYLMQPKVYSVSPAVTADCFNVYLPVINEVANTFSTQYQACITLANQRLQNLNAQATATQTAFIQQAEDICNAYHTCGAATDVLTFFNCYASVSDADVTVVYYLGINATAAGNSFSQNLQGIQLDQDTCTSATEQTYITTTASTYELLDKCLQNGLPVVATTTKKPNSSVPSENTESSSTITTEAFESTQTPPDI